MKIKSEILEFIHLDKGYCLLSGKNVQIIFEIFQMLDIHHTQNINGMVCYC